MPRRNGRAESLKLLPLPNDFSTGDGLNTAGYRWNSPSQSPVDGITTRIDFTISKTQNVFGRYTNAWRNDLINDIINTTPRPMSWPARVRLSDQQGAAIGHKWTLTDRLGVQRGALYWHVKSKRELLTEVADLILAPVFEDTGQDADWAGASVVLTSLPDDPQQPPPELELRPWESVVWRRFRS